MFGNGEMSEVQPAAVAIIALLMSLVFMTVAVLKSHWLKVFRTRFISDELEREKRLLDLHTMKRAEKERLAASERETHDKEIADLRINRAIARIFPTISDEQWLDGEWSERVGLLGRRRLVVKAATCTNPDYSFVGEELLYISRESELFMLSRYDLWIHRCLYLGTSHRRREIAAALEECADARTPIR